MISVWPRRSKNSTASLMPLHENSLWSPWLFLRQMFLFKVNSYVFFAFRSQKHQDGNENRKETYQTYQGTSQTLRKETYQGTFEGCFGSVRPQGSFTILWPTISNIFWDLFF
jgi:hypothetical protein